MGGKFGKETKASGAELMAAKEPEATTEDTSEKKAGPHSKSKLGEQNQDQTPPSDSPPDNSSQPIIGKITENVSGASDLKLFIANVDAVITQGNEIVRDLMAVVVDGELNEDFQELIDKAGQVEVNQTLAQEVKAVLHAIFDFLQDLAERADEEIQKQMTAFQTHLQTLEQQGKQEADALKANTLSLEDQRKTAAQLMYVNNTILTEYTGLAESVKAEVNFSEVSDEVVVEIGETAVNVAIRMLTLLTGVPLPTLNYDAVEEIENYIDQEIKSEKPQVLNLGATVFAQCKAHIDLVRTVVLAQKAAQEKQAETIKAATLKKQADDNVATAKEKLYQESKTTVSLSKTSGTFHTPAGSPYQTPASSPAQIRANEVSDVEPEQRSIRKSA